MIGAIAALCLAAAHVEAPHELAGDVVGTLTHHVVEPGESLIEIARLYDLGYNEIVEANPGVDAFVPEEGTVVLVPTRWIVPRAAAPGTIAVNLSEMRLYLARRPPAVLLTFPIGIGDEGTDTPVGLFRVIEKLVAPTWYPPESIRQEDPELPAAVPPGPDNPLGTHALRLSRPTILIHGTNRPWGIGRRVSHGCIRLYPEDITRLFEVVEVGTPVEIVHEPVKIGLQDGRIYVEVHEDAELRSDDLDEALRLLADRGLLEHVDAEALAVAIAQRRGIPVDVGAASSGGPAPTSAPTSPSSAGARTPSRPSSRRSRRAPSPRAPLRLPAARSEPQRWSSRDRSEAPAPRWRGRPACPPSWSAAPEGPPAAAPAWRCALREGRPVASRTSSSRTPRRAAPAR